MGLHTYGENMSVIYITKRPDSTLKEKRKLTCYHALREIVVMGESLTTHIPTNDNTSDLMTKVHAVQKRKTTLATSCMISMMNTTRVDILLIGERDHF